MITVLITGKSTIAIRDIDRQLQTVTIPTAQDTKSSRIKS